MRREEITQAFVAACSPRNLTNYDQEDEPSSCLSTDPHDETVEDAVQHYFGCIEISKRADFLKPDHPHWTHERAVQLEKYQLELSQMKAKYRSNTDNSKWLSYIRDIQDKIKEAGHVVPVDVVATLGTLSDADQDLLLQKLVNARANVWLEKRMGSAAIAIEAQYKRIRVLRNALSKTRVTAPTPGSEDVASEGEVPGRSLKLALFYLDQWSEWDRSRKQGHEELKQRQNTCKSWKFNPDHEKLLIKHVFDAQKVRDVHMVAFYQYVPYLRGFVRSRLWELAQDTKNKDIDAGATAFSGNSQSSAGDEAKQREYEAEVARFLEIQQQRQTARGPEERSFDSVGVYVSTNADEDIKKRLNKRVRAEQLLEVLGASELTVVRTLQNSGLAWRQSPRFMQGIAWVRDWKAERQRSETALARQHNPNEESPAQNGITTHPDQLCVPSGPGRNSENDQRSIRSAATIHADEPGRKEVKALVRKQRTKKTHPTNRQDPNNSQGDGTTAGTDENSVDYELEKDVNAYVIQFKIKQEADKTNQHPETFLEQHEEPLTDGRFKGTFPDQRISVSFLLDNGVPEGSNADNASKGKKKDADRIENSPKQPWNILSRNQCKSEDGSEKIRYFHIPSNNMAVCY